MMSRLNRAFSHKEIALILFLTLVLLAMVYYRMVYIPIQEEILSYDTTELENEIQVEQARAAQIRKMKEEIASGLELYNGVIMPYDNQEAEIQALNRFFEGAESFRVTARQPVATGNAIRRNMDMSFTASSYYQVEQIIAEITNCDFRCLIGNLSITPNSGMGRFTGSPLADLNPVSSNPYRSVVNCTMNVTFFETLVGAYTRDGLLIQG